MKRQSRRRDELETTSLLKREARVSHGPLEMLTVIDLLDLKRELVLAHATVLHELLDRGLDAEGQLITPVRSRDEHT